jgi:hypothetical protein
MLTKIISGGQTGADRAALDIAIELKIPHDGWIPKGRKAEDGILPDKYQLQEMAMKHSRPHLHVDFLKAAGFAAGHVIKNWIAENRIRVLNVAGSRASKQE